MNDRPVSIALFGQTLHHTASLRYRCGVLLRSARYLLVEQMGSSCYLLVNEIEPIFPVFKARLKQYAGTLSGGEQKMLLVARSLMMRPLIILLDEITEGLQPSVIGRLANALLWERNRRGMTILVIEQNVPFALKVTDRYLVLKQGEIIDEGKAKDEGATASIFEHLKV
jgi:ABC-type branched-subunit amino acid transport system ATPase component